MDILTKLNNYFLNSIQIGSLGISLIELILIFALLIISIILRGLFARVIVYKIKTIIKKTGNKVDDKLFESLAPPLKILPITIVFISIGFFVNSNNQLVVVIDKINQTLITIFVFWLLHQALFPLSYAFQKLEELLSKALVIWLMRSLKYLIIILGIVAV